MVQSNEDFDASLKHRDALWGVRNLEDVEKEANKNKLHLAEVFEMPANNLLLVIRREGN